MTLHSRSSRARIRLLEKDDSRESALVNVFMRLERGLENAVLDISEAVGNGGSQEPATQTESEEPSYVTSSSSATLAEKEQDIAGKVKQVTASPPASNLPVVSKGAKPKAGQPILTPGQLAMAESLNALPQLSKYMAFIDPIRNSHATIVARDVKNFAFHKRGWGVLQHWADNFVL